MRRNRLSSLITGVDDAPDSAAFAVEVGGFGVLIAGVFVVPVHDPEGAVGAGLGADGAEPVVVGFEEFAGVFCGAEVGGGEAGAVGGEFVVIDTVAMDVAH